MGGGVGEVGSPATTMRLEGRQGIAIKLEKDGEFNKEIKVGSIKVYTSEAEIKKVMALVEKLAKDNPDRAVRVLVSSEGDVGTRAAGSDTMTISELLKQLQAYIK